MIKIESKDTPERKKIKKKVRIHHLKWVILITIWTFLLAIIMSFISESILREVHIFVAFMILSLIIFIGILFDLIGIAVASAREKPFHAMAAKKVKGAKIAIRLIKNAGPVANFCNDVIGDICGIVSGAAGAIIIIQLSKTQNINVPLFSILLSAFVASITVGGKAIAKEIALAKSKEIVYQVAKILYSINEKIEIGFLFRSRKK